MCGKELSTHLLPFQGQQFLDQAYLHLKTEHYYKNCLARVTHLSQSLENTEGEDLFTLSEKCKRAYNGCVYLISDSKNMPICSPTRFAAITGKMRTQWQKISNTFNRIPQESPHNLCACQAQALPNLNELATWPFNNPTLIDLKPAPKVTEETLRQRGITSEQFQENQKKTVAIIGCKWGGGHMEVTRGLASNLTSLGYHPITVDMPEVLMSQDNVRNSFITRWLGQNWTTATLFADSFERKSLCMH